MKTLNLDILKKGLPGISRAMGTFYAEAAKVALTKNGHESGVTLNVTGTFDEQFQVIWKDFDRQELMDAWKMNRDTASFGAVGISLLLMIKLTNFAVFEPANLKTGIDYWMGELAESNEKSEMPELNGRLEISGIFKASKSNSINMRVNLKKKQTQQSDDSKVPAWISVVEFGIPKTKLIKK